METHRCRANMAHTGQSRPDSGLAFRYKSLKHFMLFPLRLKAVRTRSDDSRMVGTASAPKGNNSDLRGFRRNVKRFRGGLVFKAHRLLHHSTLGLRVIKKDLRGLEANLLPRFREEVLLRDLCLVRRGVSRHLETQRFVD